MNVGELQRLNKGRRATHSARDRDNIKTVYVCSGSEPLTEAKGSCRRLGVSLFCRAGVRT